VGTHPGFTLIELLMVIIIVSSLSVIAIPLWFGHTHQHRVATDKLIYAIFFTQQMAMHTGKNAYLDIDTGASTYTGYLMLGSTESPATDTRILPTVTLDAPLILTSSHAFIAFDGILGQPCQSPLPCGAETYSLSIDSPQLILPISIDTLGELTES